MPSKIPPLGVRSLNCLASPFGGRGAKPAIMTTTAFAEEVRAGLAAHPRRLSSKWFYDARGDELFQAIMAAPEYYLTDCEREIYRHCGPELLTHVGNRPFDLVELGAGDGSKTQFLIEAFLTAGADFRYRPVDISAHALEQVGTLVGRRWPKLTFAPLNGDYFAALDRLEDTGGRTRLVLFPGGNVGNFPPPEAAAFLTRLRSYLRPGDLLLTGFDLKKDPAVILAAYNDAAGHTAAFNLNLLARMNRELGADFDPAAWRHWQHYDPVSGACRSCLLPLSDQVVRIAALDETYRFAAHEPIAVEISQKYATSEVDRLADDCGYERIAHFRDERGYFTDALWRV